MSKHRYGFTFIEMMMVFAIFGIMLAFGIPRFTDARSAYAVRSARDNVAAYLATARAAAIRRGQAARFIIDGAAIDVQVESTPGVFAPLHVRDDGTSASRRDLGAQFAVAIEMSGASTVEYNPRGFAQLGGTQRFIILRADKRDSVCVSGLGVIMRQGCGL